MGSKVNGDNAASKSLSVKYLKVLGAVSLYWFVSICMVFLNKYLLKSNLNLDAPLFVTWFQCLETVVLCQLCAFLANKYPSSLSFPSLTFDHKLSREALPLSVVFIAMITFNNLCLKEVGVAFYTIARSLVTVFSLIFTYVLLGKGTSAKALACCALLLFGFSLGVNQESLGALSVIGVVYGVASSAFVALNAIYIKKILPKMDDEIWKLTYYNNINATVLFIPFILFSEVNEILTFQHIFSSSFWLIMMTAGFFGFVMGYVVGFQIKVTTPVTHTISGVAKACFQTVIAVIYYKEVKTSLWWCSNALVLLGTGSYSVVKSMDMKTSHEATNHGGTSSDEENANEKLPNQTNRV